MHSLFGSPAVTSPPLHLARLPCVARWEAMGNANSTGEHPTLGTADLAQAANLLRSMDVPETVPLHFWSVFWDAPDGATEVYSLIQPEGVRAILEHFPRNLARLLCAVAGKLGALGTQDKLSASDCKAALNCCRLLTRVMPIVFEDPEHPVAHKFLWDNLLPPSSAAVEAAHTEATLDDSGGAAETKAAVPPTAAAPPALWVHLGEVLEAAQSQAIEGSHQGDAPAPGPVPHAFLELTTLSVGEPVGRQIAHGVMRMCVAPDLGVDPRGWALYKDQVAADGEGAPASDATNAVWPSLLWYGGVGSPLKPATTFALDAHRQELLRCLISLLSAELFVSPDPRAPARSSFSDALVGADTPFAPTLFCSLLNAAAAMDPAGLSMLPYSAAFLPDHPVVTATLCLQALLLLLNYAPLVQVGGEEEAVAPLFNRYRVMLSNISDPREYALVYKSIVMVLQNSHAVKSTWLAYTQRELNAEQEGIILLWKCLDENRGFMQWVLTSPDADVTAFVKPLCYLLWTGRSNPARVGLINISVFVLLLLSGEREFAVALNGAYPGDLPTDFPAFTGSFADLLVITLHKLVIAGDARLGSLFPCVFTILNNITPYTKALCLVSAVKLMSLLELCSDPVLLLNKPAAPSFLNQLLMAFNNIIQYQYGGNPHIVYSMVRRADIFSALARVHSVGDLKALSPSTAPPPLEVPPPPAATAAVPEEAATTPVAAPSTAPSTPSFNAPPEDPAGESVGEGAVVTTNPSSPPPPSSTVDPPSPPQQPVGGSEDGGEQEEEGGSQQEEAATAPAADEQEVTEAPAGEAAAEEEEDLEAWLETWVHEMHAHLHAIHAMLGHLVPQVRRLLSEGEGTVDEDGVLSFISGTTMVGLLPVPHALVMHKYAANDFTQLWFTTFLWGVVFLRNQEFPVYDTRRIKLFAIAVE